MHINFIRHATVQTSRCFYVKQKNDIFPVHFCFTLEFLLPTNYQRESATSFFSPHLPTWVGSTHGLWVSGFKKDTSIAYLPIHLFRCVDERQVGIYSTKASDGIELVQCRVF